MARPPKEKPLSLSLQANYFRPRGIPVYALKKVALSAEELEVLSLVDVQGLSQTDAANKLGVHQSTVARILARAQKKVATALVRGYALVLNEA